MKKMTDEEKKQRRKEIQKKWNLKNKEKLYEYQKEWHNQYKATQMGRAVYLVAAYKQNDKKAERGEGDITPKWVVENIFTKHCTHCGETDWHRLGCNRIDNSKPHTMDNVEPCCEKCNKQLRNNEYKKQVFQYTTTNTLVKIWDCLNECGKNTFNIGRISECCNGKRKIYKGYKWSYVPL